MEYDALDLSLRNLSLYVLTFGIILESAYQKVRYLSKKYRDSEDSIDWKHELIPFLVSIPLVLSFYPTTYFTYMPFLPNHVGLDIFYTSLIVSRFANGSHSSYEKISNLVQSLIGRVTKRF